MATLMPETHEASSFGKQSFSAKPTGPSHGFGTAARDAGERVFVSEIQEKKKSAIYSRGPVYNLPSHVGETSKWGFLKDEQRKHPKAKYPDSSVDVNCATVDSQTVKFHSTKRIHFGSEAKGSTRNAEIIRVNPALALGVGSPGALEYEGVQAEERMARRNPQYSFAPPPPPKKEGDKDNKKKEKDQPVKTISRCHIPLTGAPLIGPGSHDLDPSLDKQPRSARRTAAAYSFGGASPRPGVEDKSGQVLEISPNLSALGKQVASRNPTRPRATFGEATRGGNNKALLVMHDLDRGPVANMAKANHHFDIPRPPVRMPVGLGH